MITVYTDGSCSGNPGPGGWGVIILYPDGNILELSGITIATTNNRMEIQACIEALKVLNGTNHKITIYTDSQYLIKGATEYKRNVNHLLWKELDELMKDKKIKFVWVKGHSGDYWNDRADTLAKGW